jgi:hypothetical protein
MFTGWDSARGEPCIFENPSDWIGFSKTCAEATRGSAEPRGACNVCPGDSVRDNDTSNPRVRAAPGGHRVSRISADAGMVLAVQDQPQREKI